MTLKDINQKLNSILEMLLQNNGCSSKDLLHLSLDGWTPDVTLPDSGQLIEVDKVELLTMLIDGKFIENLPLTNLYYITLKGKAFIKAGGYQTNKLSPKTIEIKSFRICRPLAMEIFEFLPDLKDCKLINENTKLARFKRIFNGEVIINKVDWTGSIASLNFFINQLCIKEKENCKEENRNNKKKWYIAAHCFTNDNKALTHEQIQNNRDVSSEDKTNIKNLFNKNH